MRAALSSTTAARIGGAVITLAGIYQLTPLKDLCLSKCRTPITFIMTSWRDGAVGALRMGLLHGAYCLGCCWLLFVILFPLGIMNIAAMAVITLIVFAEKTLPWGGCASASRHVHLHFGGHSRLVEHDPHHLISAPRYCTGSLVLARLILGGCQSKHRPDRLGLREAGRYIVNHRSDAGDGHPAPAHVIVPDDGQHAAIKTADASAYPKPPVKV